MALTDTGLVIDRFPKLLTTASQDIDAAFDLDVDLSTDSLIGVLNSLVVRGESELWELLQGVYDSNNLLSAEGEMLENLALLVGHVRLPASRSTGSVWVTSTDGHNILLGTRFSSISDDIFTTTIDTIVSSTSCQNARMYVRVVEDNFVYNINIDGNVFSYTSNVNATKLEILNGISEEIMSYGAVTSNVVNEAEPYLYITKIVPTSNMAMSAVTYLQFDHVTTPVLCRSEEVGRVQAPAGTVTSLIDKNILTVYNISNPLDFVVGNPLEEDYQLRERVFESYAGISHGTYDTTLRAVKEVQSVLAVKVKENTAITTDAEGLPPKSYKVVAYGGNDYQVAEAIWKAKPAGLQPWSDLLSDQTVKVSILDYNNQAQTVLLTRPDIKYVWLRVEYTLYDEESFPQGGDLIIAETAAATGQLLSIGEDVIPNRFIGPIYKNLSGLDDVTVFAAITDDINITPAPNDYVSTRLPISDEEVTDFAAIRVEAVPV